MLAELSPPEALHLLQPIVLDDYTTLPDSMQTAAYDIRTIDRFRYPFYQARASCLMVMVSRAWTPSARLAMLR